MVGRAAVPDDVCAGLQDTQLEGAVWEVVAVVAEHLVHHRVYCWEPAAEREREGEKKRDSEKERNTEGGGGREKATLVASTACITH